MGNLRYVHINTHTRTRNIIYIHMHVCNAPCAHLQVDTSRPVTANSEDTDGDTLTKVMDVNSFSYLKHTLKY